MSCSIGKKRKKAGDGANGLELLDTGPGPGAGATAGGAPSGQWACGMAAPALPVDLPAASASTFWRCARPSAVMNAVAADGSTWRMIPHPGGAAVSGSIATAMPTPPLLPPPLHLVAEGPLGSHALATGNTPGALAQGTPQVSGPCDLLYPAPAAVAAAAPTADCDEIVWQRQGLADAHEEERQWQQQPLQQRWLTMTALT